MKRANGEGKGKISVVGVLGAGLESVVVGIVLAGGVLADSVGETIHGIGFGTGSHIEVAPVDDKGIRFKMLSHR